MQKMRTLFAVIVVCAQLLVDLNAAPPSAPDDPPSSPTTNGVYGLDELEMIAMQHHPSLVEDFANISAAEGRALQVRRAPNPIVGYVANEIGNAGTAGQHGLYVSKTVVRGNKLQLAAQSANRQTEQLRQRLEATRLTILGQVRDVFFEAVVLERRIKIAEYLSAVDRRAAMVAAQLAESGDGLQLDEAVRKLELQQSEADLAALTISRQALLRQLAITCGRPHLRIESVSGNLTERLPELTLEEALQIVESHPALAAADAEIATRQSNLQQARAQTVGNLNLQASVQFDADSNDFFAGVQMGTPLPTQNKYRGAIAEASANLQSAIAKRAGLQLNMQQRMINRFRVYQASKARADRLVRQLLPQSIKALDTATKLYDATEISYQRLLDIQRLTAKLDLQFLDANDEAWSVYQSMMSLTAESGDE